MTTRKRSSLLVWSIDQRKVPELYNGTPRDLNTSSLQLDLILDALSWPCLLGIKTSMPNIGKVSLIELLSQKRPRKRDEGFKLLDLAKCTLTFASLLLHILLCGHQVGTILCDRGAE